MQTDPQLIISANCLRRSDFHERVEAAAAAGFSAIGLRVNDYLSALQREGLARADLRSILDHHAVTVYEVEAAWDWTKTTSSAHLQQLEILTQMHHDVGFRQFNTFIFEDASRAAIVEGYAALCDVLPEVTFGFENIGYGPVVTLSEAMEVVDHASRTNARLILDSWHFHRTGSVTQDVFLIDPTTVCSIQISDVLTDALPDMAHEARHDRQFPEAGASDLSAWLAAVIDHGIRVPISIEVVNDSLDAERPAHIARVQYRALTRLIASAVTAAPVNERACLS